MARASAQLVEPTGDPTMTTNRNGTGVTGTNEATMGANLDQKIDTLKEKAKGFVDQGQEKVEQIKSRVVEVKDQAMAKGNAFLDRATEMIRANPLKSVAIAFGVGYIGMRLFRR
jgi:ElaB/YqjD/DUF883 family membrane-anchored ribosome-binding protein